MEENLPLVITISRQFGCGGTSIGQKIASNLNFLLLDREIIHQAAERLNVEESELSKEDEKTSYFLSLLRPNLYINIAAPTNPNLSEVIASRDLLNKPTTREIQNAEADVISDIAQKKSCVIIGRGGNFILRDHPKHISIFLHANKAYRQQQIQERYNVTLEKAVDLVESTDKNRAKFVHSFTKHDMTDATQYDITLDTGVLGADQAVNIIMNYIKERFPETY